MPLLSIDGVDLAYRQTPVLADIRCTLDAGDIGCLLGPSGCGKTSLLRAIGGFEPISGGSITLADHLVSRPGWSLPPEQRPVGMVFQDLALFPHLSVERNIAFGLHKARRSARRERVRELLALVGLPGYGHAYPHQLSGGQQQRVALARALAPRPQLLLLDEPFSGLDAALRSALVAEVRTILRQAGTTAILVTHDQEEAFAFADWIGVLHDGRLLQWDSGYNLYHRPACRTVARFVGQGRLIAGRVIDDTVIETALGRLTNHEPVGLPRQARVEVLVRPDDLVPSDPACSKIQAIVTDCSFRGAECLYTLRLASGEEVLCLTPSHTQWAVGTAVGLGVDQRHLVAFPARDVEFDQLDAGPD